MSDTADSAAFDDVEKRQLLAQLQQKMFGQKERVRLGRYVLQERLGSGAMGVVFVAEDPELRRKVALKVLHADASAGQDGKRQRRLETEARSLGQLSHPNVIRVFDVGRAGNRVYFAMELVPGLSLEAWLRQGEHAWRDIVDRFVQAGRGLQAAHEAGVAHRDFKPSNVQLGDDGRVRVLDFGLAKEFVPLPSASSENDFELGGDDRITVDGAIVGTPRYMAPEQLKGGFATAKSDQYAFCVALFEALHGEPPFAEDAMLASKLGADRTVVRPRSKVPVTIQRALARGLSPDPVDRFATMAALIDAIEQSPRSKLRIGLGVAALAVLGLAAATLGSPAERPPAEEAAASSLASPPSPPSPPSPWIVQTRAELEALMTLRGSSQLAAADLISAQLLERTEAIGDPTLVAEAQLRRGEVLLMRERPEAAALLEAAHAQAMRNHEDGLRARAAILLGQLAKNDPGRRQDTERWVAEARSLDDQLDDRMRFELGRIEVSLLEGRDPDAAITAAQALTDFARDTWGSNAYELSTALEALGTQLIRVQRIDEARSALDEAIEIELGAAEPAETLLGSAYLTRSFVEGLDAARHQNDSVMAARAIDFSRQAEHWYAKISGPDGDAARSARVNTAQLLLRAGRHEEARREIEDMQPTLERDGPNLAVALETLGSALAELGELEAAQEHLERAVVVIESIRGTDHPAVSSALYQLGLVQERRGSIAEARKTFERLVGLAPAVGPGAYASALEGLANLELSAKEYERAAELYDQSAEAWITMVGEDSSQVANVRRAAAGAREWGQR